MGYFVFSATSTAMGRNICICASLAALITNAVIVATLRHSSAFSDRGLMVLQVRIAL